MSRHPLRGRSAFQTVFNHGKRTRSSWLVLVTAPNEKSVRRFGCVVRRSVSSSSVRRNKLKRWLREAFWKNQSACPESLDVVAVAQRWPAPDRFETVENEILNILKTNKL